METKHTKGNWRNGLEKRRAVVCDKAEGKIVTICSTDVSNHINQEEAVANAKLIAASPEMLAALIECKNLLEKTPYENLHLQDLVCNAINKATK